MPDATQRILQAALTGTLRIGQVLIRNSGAAGFVLTHSDEAGRDSLRIFRDPEDALHIARNDDGGKYRPLKTAPNLCHGWQLELETVEEVRRALDYFYPGRLEVFASWKEHQIRTTSLRETLARQTGMYRVASQISDEQAGEVIGDFCRSDGGCLRVILWRRDPSGAVPSAKLPPEKFDPGHDEGSGAIPLLCQEACNLLVAECRKVVKSEGVAPSAPASI